MATIKAASIKVSLEAESARFSEALDRAQRQAAKSSNGIIRSLSELEKKSQAFDKKVSAFLDAPFKAFNKATAPFRIMARQVSTIVSNLAAPFIRFASRAAPAFSKAFNLMKSAMSAFLSGAKSVALSAAALAGSFVALVISSSKASLEINKSAKMLGISYEELNKVVYVTGQFGVSAEQTADAMKDLTAKIEDAAFAGSGALVPFFTAINQKASDWAKLSPTEQLISFAEELSKMDPQTALYWADEVNDTMSGLTPMLMKGEEYFRAMREEAEMFGAKVNGLDQLDQVKGMFARLTFTARNFFTGVGANLAPMITNAFDTAIEKFKTYLVDLGDGDGALGFQKFVDNVAIGVLEGALGMWKAVTTVFDSIKSAFDSVVTFINDLKTATGYGTVSLTTKGKAALTEDDKANIEVNERLVKNAKQLEYERNELIAKRDNLPNDKEFQKLSLREKAKVQARYNDDIKAYTNSLNNIAKNNNIKEYGFNQDSDLISTQLAKKNNNIISAANARGEFARTETGPSKGELYIQSKIDELANKDYTKKEETKEETKVNPLNTANDAFMKSLQNANVDVKSPELGLDAYNTLVSKTQQEHLRYIENVTSIEQKANQDIAILKAGSVREISLLESQMTEHNKEAIQQKINEVRIKELELIKTIERTKDEALKEEAKKKKEELDKEYKEKREQAIKERDEKRKMSAFEKMEQQAWKDAGIHKEELNEYQVKQLKMTEFYDEEIQRINDKYVLDEQMHEEDLKRVEELKNAKLLALETIREIEEQNRLDSRFEYDDELNNLFDYFSERENATNTHTQAINGFKNEEITAAKGNAQAQMGIALASGSALLAEGAKHNEKMFKMNKMLSKANAVMNTATGMTKALEWGFPMGPIFAGLIGASGALQIALINRQQFSGQAHDGIDYVDNGGKREGTWILEHGERVLSKNQNRDLTDFLNGSNESTSTSSSTVDVNAPITIQGSNMNPDQLVKALSSNLEGLGQLIGKATRNGYV